MRNPARLRLIGFVLVVLGGIGGAVGMMYQLKLKAVDNWSSDICWYLNMAAMLLLPMIGGQLLQRAGKLAKIGNSSP